MVNSGEKIRRFPLFMFINVRVSLFVFKLFKSYTFFNSLIGNRGRKIFLFEDIYYVKKNKRPK